MGSYWEQYSHHGRPLSVALNEPLDPYETFGDFCYHNNNQNVIDTRNRSRSSGRRYNRECYSLQYITPPPFIPFYPQRHREREMLVEKIETVTIEEQLRPPPVYHPPLCIPEIRQLKVRKPPRPSSCYSIYGSDTHRHESHWSKVEEKNHTVTNDRIVPEPSCTTISNLVERVISNKKDVMTSTEDLHVSKKSKDAGTDTTGLPSKPRRPLCKTETQIIERYEQTENRIPIVYTEESYSYKDGSMKRPLQGYYDGTLNKTVNIWTSDDRKNEKNRIIIRPTSKPREVLVDTSGIFSGADFSEPTSPQPDTNKRITFTSRELL
ncbi:unnamed protein product [Didymodactylos carnosus]|uniref:Uncharacterized protein n=1 Tax=Didymodactylos carnosus TaxID=1234261 RepID=A0A814AP13_9BILA|nr:unnamed protein product [Didymodactylos carnosus]CAF0916337.1 unnamed protein product [Didymodactylos carnosus]CAF3636532.1 unnamed protein product [Didymodactylos carnosus]CAF3696377.1 unnamed protein product [Didymodactylos carnosus]